MLWLNWRGRWRSLSLGGGQQWRRRAWKGRSEFRAKSASREVKVPGAPAWEPAWAGREAGRAPELTGLGTGQGRAGGRGSARASRPVCRPGPGWRPGRHPREGTPAWGPAVAGHEAGGVPEPTGLGAGLGRVRGRLTPKFAQISQSSSILLVLISLTSEHFVSLEIP